jgi:hypothetical protein
MCFVSFPELKLHLVTTKCLHVLQEQIEATRSRLVTLLFLEDELPKSEQTRILRNFILDPSFTQPRLVT